MAGFTQLFTDPLVDRVGCNDIQQRLFQQTNRVMLALASDIDRDQYENE